MTSQTKLPTQQNLFQKFRFYRMKYGLVHLAAAYLGRKSPKFWRVVARRVTQPYVSRYLAKIANPMLNLGSGSHCIEGFLNVDMDARADAYTDITRPLPFPNSSFVAIFCEEVLEHVAKSIGEEMLRDCFRILTNGGTLRITTPSLEYFVQTLEIDSMGSAINKIFYGHDHRHIYTKLALTTVLTEVGFENIRWSQYRDGGAKLGKYDSHPARFSHEPTDSHYVEASKPLHSA